MYCILVPYTSTIITQRGHSSLPLLNKRSSSVESMRPLSHHHHPLVHHVSPVPSSPAAPSPAPATAGSSSLARRQVNSSTTTSTAKRFDADVRLPEDLPPDARLLTPIRSVGRCVVVWCTLIVN